MQDLAFVRFESLAEQYRLLTDPGAFLEDTEAWESADVHRAIRPGQLLRLRNDVQVFDPSFFLARLERLSDFSRAITELTAADELRGRPERDRQRLLAEAERAIWQGGDPTAVRRIANVMASLMSNVIALRVLPCGRQRPELSFGGALLDRAEYLQKEREALFSRFGAVLSGWTTIVQIETIPTQPSVGDIATIDSAGVMLSQLQINRAAAEKMCLDLLGLVDNSGLTEGPRWPSIAVTPLAIYRYVTPDPKLDQALESSDEAPD